MTTVCMADEEDDYARPDGEDEFGPAYEVTEIPTEMREILDEAGEYAVPSFINRTVTREGQECWVFDQLPIEGTVVTCPQTFNVDLKYTCDGEDEHLARLPIELIDITRPEISITLTSADNPHTSFGGVLRYPAEAEVVPLIDVYDACGVQEEFIHNGQPYQYGTPITGVGLHFLNVRGEDTSGSFSSKSMMFEIRERPSHTAALVVESTEFTPHQEGDGGMFRATVLIGSNEFDHHKVLRSSATMMIQGPGGGFLTTPSGPGIVSTPNGPFMDCAVMLDFESEVDADPADLDFAKLYIFGVGIEGEETPEITFEWGGNVLNEADPTPWDTMANILGSTSGCGDDPPNDPPSDPPDDPEPPVPCQAVDTFAVFPASCTVPWTSAGLFCTPGSGSDASSLAGLAVHGASQTVVSPLSPAINCALPLTNCPMITGNTLVAISFVGNCCNCSATYTGNANVTAYANVTGLPLLSSGTAGAAGSIIFTPPCGPVAMAPATASVYDSLGTSGPVAGPTLPGPVNCTVPGCVPSMMTIQSLVTVGTAASATNPAATFASADLTSTVSNLNISAVFAECEDCEPEADEDCESMQPE